MKMPWLNDPTNNNPSVSLSLLVVSTVLLIGAGIAQVLDKIQSLGPFTELFYSCTALYFSRRLSISGKTYSSDKAEEIKEKVE